MPTIFPVDATTGRVDITMRQTEWLFLRTALLSTDLTAARSCSIWTATATALGELVQILLDSGELSLQPGDTLSHAVVEITDAASRVSAANRKSLT
eukprot:3066474-Pleurochrysis_carterae.AAC.1